VSAVPGAPILEALRAALAFEASGDPAGNLTIGRGNFERRPVHVALVENRTASGALGALECQRLAALFKIVAAERSSLVLYLDSAGAKVSEGLKALGAFRALYRAGLEAGTATEARACSPTSRRNGSSARRRSSRCRARRSSHRRPG
jgi:acetyl-CoA carboxylase carboxyltransferase component